MLRNAPVFATIPCVDLAGAREFYGQTLGLVEMQSFEDDESPAVLYQGGDGTTLLVYQRSTPTKADHTSASWAVKDIDAVADYMINKGVKLLVYDEMPGVKWDERGVASAGDLKSVWFTDPEGNILSVVQMP